jgi:signal-transduction protein with cAMP-binding, CBS, and nucleotidyltransferase domain
MSADPPRLLVADLALLPPLIVHATTPVRDVATAMLRRQTSSALIAETGAIITERDLVRLLAEGASPDTPADTAATPAPRTIDATATVLEAIDTMVRARHRTLLVIDTAARPRGFVTLLDAAASLLEHADVPGWLGGLRFALRVEFPTEPSYVAWPQHQP